MYFCAFFSIQINRLHLLELLPVYNFTLLHLKHYLILYVHTLLLGQVQNSLSLGLTKLTLIQGVWFEQSQKEMAEELNR